MHHALSRRHVIGSAAAAAFTAALPGFAHAAVSDRSRRLYERAIVMDALGGLGGWAADANPEDPDFSPGQLADIRSSGVSLCNVTVSEVGNVADAYEKTVANIAFFARETARFPDAFMPVRTSSDLRAAKISRRLGLVYGFQDTIPLGVNIDRLQQFDDLGVRLVQPVYNRRNLMGDGCLEPANAGLSRLGRDLVADLNKRRIAVDLSHAGQRTQAEGIAASTRPPLITIRAAARCRIIRATPGMRK